MAFFYILQSETTGRFYIGSTTDLERRLAEHGRGQTPSTRQRGPWQFVYKEKFSTLQDARQQERRLKAWKSHKAVAEFVAEQGSRG